MTSSIYELYGEIWGEIDHEVEFDVRQSLNPRNPNLLFEMFADLGVSSNSTVLDVGCREGIYAAEIARRFSCPVIAIDPVPLHIENTKRFVAKVELEDRIDVKTGGIEALPLDDESIDYVWCRDVLIHVDLPKGLAECFRVLKPGGIILIYNVFATPLCERKEAARLFKALSIVPENMSEKYFERIAQDSGFEILNKDKIDSEWHEASIEVGANVMLDILLFATRLRRAKEQLILKYGKNRYEANYGVCLWELYPMLGKLCPMIYVLKKPSKSE
jgi:ubiquinone/menaquinone biosynthesis C-methylase UbiE